MNQAAAEFSYEIVLDDLPKGGRKFLLEANDVELDAVANRLGVLAVDKLSGELWVSATKERFSVRGRVAARLKRECVVSLEEIVEAIDEPFETEFVRRAAALENDDEEISLDSPEIHEDAELDIGELLVQQLALAIDPYPRKPGVARLVAEFGVEDEASPLAQALALAAKREENQ